MGVSVGVAVAVAGMATVRAGSSEVQAETKAAVTASDTAVPPKNVVACRFIGSRNNTILTL